MLEGLKRDIARDKMSDILFEVATRTKGDESIKDAFLDDPEMQVIGAENDPEINKLIAMIPEYEGDGKDVDLKSLEESLDKVLI